MKQYCSYRARLTQLQGRLRLWVGQQKLNLVLNAAGAAWELGEVAEQINKTNWLAAVQAMTTIAVAGLKAVGVFGTSAGPSSFSGTPVATTTVAAPVSSN